MRRSSAVTILVVLALAAASTSSAQLRISSSGDHDHYVHVLDELTGGKALEVHCWSKEEDLGTHNLTVGSEFTWKILFSKISLEFPQYWCDLAADDDRKASFPAFDQEHYRVWEFQYHTHLVAQDDGIYLRHPDAEMHGILFHWQHGSRIASPNL
ncbi:unnamed protein product [Linum tenue]|uniref:S-protein homolog n=1 Tax=Linum tenue TaxID=586396 RepID=A0AAV0Q2K7_9ROSI|nr:unnamed protein product [Linum tenue]